MAVACVVLDDKEVAKLIELGVRDSKTLSPRGRELLAEEIKALSTAFKVVLVPPSEIDKAVAMKGLNKLEARIMASLIDDLMPDVAYVDASDVDETRFALMINAYLRSRQGVRIVAEHGADAKYPIVSAASILAKVERDGAISRLREELGIDFGSGYPTDPKTIAFLRSWYAEHGSYPPFVRRSWKTAKEIAAELGTRKLDEWG